MAIVESIVLGPTIRQYFHATQLYVAIVNAYPKTDANLGELLL